MMEKWLIFLNPKRPWTTDKGAWGAVFCEHFCIVIVAHVRGKNLQEHGSYRVKAKKLSS